MATTRLTTNANLQVLKSASAAQTGATKSITLGDLQRVINVGVLGGFTTGPATTGGGATNPGTTGPAQTGGRAPRRSPPDLRSTYRRCWRRFRSRPTAR